MAASEATMGNILRSGIHWEKGPTENKVALQVNHHVTTEYAGKWSPASSGAVIMQVGKGVS